jgi:hypothetical protein
MCFLIVRKEFITVVIIIYIYISVSFVTTEAMYA